MVKEQVISLEVMKNEIKEGRYSTLECAQLLGLGAVSYPAEIHFTVTFTLRNRNLLREEATLSIPLLSFSQFVKISKLLNNLVDTYETTGWDFKLPLKKMDNGQKGYSFTGAKSWNGLSAGAQWEPYLTF